MREVRVVLAFLDGKEQFLFEVNESRLSVRVFVEFEFRLVDQLAQLGVFHHPRESLVAWLAELQLEQRAARFILPSSFVGFLGFGGKPVAKHGLLANELLHQRLKAVILVGGDGGRAADDQRSAGLVDENGVHFVNDGKVVGALDLLVAAGGHAVVAQVIESELAVRAVGNVAEVLGAAQLRWLVVLNRYRRKGPKRCRAVPSTRRRGEPDSR